MFYWFEAVLKHYSEILTFQADILNYLQHTKFYGMRLTLVKSSASCHPLTPATEQGHVTYATSGSSLGTPYLVSGTNGIHPWCGFLPVKCYRTSIWYLFIQLTYQLITTCFLQLTLFWFVLEGLTIGGTHRGYLLSSTCEYSSILGMSSTTSKSCKSPYDPKGVSGTENPKNKQDRELLLML